METWLAAHSLSGPVAVAPKYDRQTRPCFLVQPNTDVTDWLSLSLLIKSVQDNLFQPHGPYNKLELIGLIF